MGRVLGNFHLSLAHTRQTTFSAPIVLTTESEGRLTIIDGQQRLATTAILFAAIRDEFKDRNDHQRATIIQDEFLSTQIFRDRLT